MNFLRVNPEKCIRDGLCAAECPLGIITMNDDGPASIQQREPYCIQCGHCVAVCPHGALSLDSMPVEECQELADNWQLTPEQIDQFLKGRRSVRRYTSENVERHTISQIIDTARFAPSGQNLQPVHWHVVYDRAEVQRLGGIVVEWMRSLVSENAPLAQRLHANGLVNAWDTGKDLIMRGAPHLVVAHAPRADQAAPTACTIALTYLELAALPYHLGACWAGYFHLATMLSPDVNAALHLPDGHQCCGAMLLGHSKATYHRIPLRKAPPITWQGC